MDSPHSEHWGPCDVCVYVLSDFWNTRHYLQAVVMMGRLRQELDSLHGSPFLCGLQQRSELDQLPVTRLQQLRAQLQQDLNTLDKVTK